MPPSKTGWPSLNVVIFLHVMRLVLDDPKKVTTPEINDHIHELSLEDRLISAKSIAEQLGISRERVGSIIHEDLDMRKLSAKWVQKCLNADQKRQRCQSSEQPLEFFRPARSKWFPVAIGCHGRNLVISLWPGDKATINGVAAQRLTPPQKVLSAKIRWKKLSPWFFGIKTASSSLIIFQSAKLSTPSIIYLCWCNWRTFWRKTAAESSPRGSSSCTTMPRLTGHLQPKRNWPTWASNVLITHPILRIWPRRTTTCFLDWKNNWKVAIFRPTRRSLLPRRPGWTDKLQIFFFLSGLQKLEQPG